MPTEMYNDKTMGLSENKKDMNIVFGGAIHSGTCSYSLCLECWSYLLSSKYLFLLLQGAAQGPLLQEAFSQPPSLI